MADFEVYVDRQSIAEGEEWQARLGALIAEADTVVFVLSPASAKSKMCRWEVEEAHRKAKRILPVLALPLGTVNPPPLLAKLNYVRFDEDASFVQSLKRLTKALKVDLEWVREQTRLLVRASEWEESGRPESRLLSGADVDAARRWLESRPADGPIPTALHAEYIAASEAAERWEANEERQRLEAMKEMQQKLARGIKAGIVALAVVLCAALAASVLFALKTQQLQVADLRLREGMKLRIADTDHVVVATQKWYRVATDYKLAVGVMRNIANDRQIGFVGSGFLIDGGLLSEAWTGRVVFLTAAHVLTAYEPVETFDPGNWVITFPALGDSEMKLTKMLFISKDADFAVLGISAKPANATVISAPVQMDRQLDPGEGVAVLHWTANDGFVLGIGHGKSNPTADDAVGRFSYTHVTGPGASGAPVFSLNSAELTCLHQSGDTRTSIAKCVLLSEMRASIKAASR